jgi:hypothetical protein
MTEVSPRRPSIHDIDQHEARRRARFADLALIAPTPEMIRQVLELELEADAPTRSAVIVVEPGPAAVTTQR